LPKGYELDLMIGGLETDVKMTIGYNWIIPPEAIGKPCILIAFCERLQTYSFGVIVARRRWLNRTENRDKKLTLSTKGREHIHWIARERAFQ
jgi:restriction endonuclease NaeI